ncbi:MAG: hypothetical protein JST68_12885 [Bacteroidetes bacterium]|nr:hypothetical protein [Bacteroidota bacterium]
MELKKLQNEWDSFPEVSMEERPVLSSDLEKIVVKNPLSDAFYLRKKLLVRIAAISSLWLLNVGQLRIQWITNGNDLYPVVALFGLLSYSLYFHIRLLKYADYPTLLSLPLVIFLGKLETVLDKYILSFKFISGLAGFYVLSIIQIMLSRWSTGASQSLSTNNWYKWLIMIFIAISVDILFLRTIIPRYQRILETVRKYKDGIQAKGQNK